MPIILKTGATTATTGGVDQTFDRTSRNVTNGYEYTDVAEPDFYARNSVIVKARMPSRQSDGTYSKHKVTIQGVFPLILADGSMTYNTVRLDIDYHPETPAVKIAAMREQGAQMAIGAQFDNVVDAGTLPS